MSENVIEISAVCSQVSKDKKGSQLMFVVSPGENGLPSAAIGLRLPGPDAADSVTPGRMYDISIRERVEASGSVEEGSV
jgi:hypothetical protein